MLKCCGYIAYGCFYFFLNVRPKGGSRSVGGYRVAAEAIAIRWWLETWPLDGWNMLKHFGAAGSSAGRRDACAGISIWHISLMFLNFYQKLPWSEGTTKHVVGVVWKSLTIILSLHLAYIALVVLLFCDACTRFARTPSIGSTAKPKSAEKNGVRGEAENDTAPLITV